MKGFDYLIHSKQKISEERAKKEKKKKNRPLQGGARGVDFENLLFLFAILWSMAKSENTVLVNGMDLI